MNDASSRRRKIVSPAAQHEVNRFISVTESYGFCNPWDSVDQIYKVVVVIYSLDILIKGTASDVLGMDSETVFRNTVNDRSIVTSATTKTKLPKCTLLHPTCR